ncbi:hypothetical protein NZK32_17460 [Cyanobium sp. FGCU-52]|nr:hypothetical protein [Cyanobium sp. FGCU52]
MTSSALPEPLEAFPIPMGAVLLPHQEGHVSERDLALQALRKVLAQRRLALPLGPEVDPADPARLLSLNHFALQLATAPFPSDQISFLSHLWKGSASSPQLLLAALVDEENDVVWFPGVLTGPEVVSALGSAPALTGAELTLEVADFRGGIDRLLTLVQVLDPAAIPRAALGPVSGMPLVVSVREWLEGFLSPAMAALGTKLLPRKEGAFRSRDLPPSGIPDALAILSIPLGLDGDGTLHWGEAARPCVERFQLLLIPSASEGIVPEQLILQLVGELQGDLLPDGLLLTASQGNRRQSISSASTTALQLRIPADPALIEVSLTAPGGTTLQLPPLQLPL